MNNSAPNQPPSSKSTGALRFVVALNSEAKPIVEHYRLKRDQTAKGFTVFSGEPEVALIVAGIGRVAAAAATAFLHVYRHGVVNAAWLNVGIAGHREHSMGSAHLAQKIVAPEPARQCWYPPLIVDPPANCGTAVVATVDAPVTDYPSAALYEMEAAGFYPTATRFSTAELVQVIKIVSDNAHNPIARINATNIESLIADALDSVTDIASQTAALGAELAALEQAPPRFDEFLHRWQFSTAERHRLFGLLSRWQVLCPETELDPGGCASGKALLRWLDAQLLRAGYDR